MSITSRILVTDLLTNRLTTEIVAGVVVLNAHGSSHCEQFACELYRERKQKGRGFIAAFTDNPIRCRTLMNVESSSNLGAALLGTNLCGRSPSGAADRLHLDSAGTAVQE